MSYQHQFLDGTPFSAAPGKVVCVGRNYAEHAKELNNPVPESPILFMKPATAMVRMGEGLELPAGLGACHHELEMAVLIGAKLSRAAPENAMLAVAGYGLALDLTLRDLQSQLKTKGHPWERAKAFDGACPISNFISVEAISDWQQCGLRLTRNGAVQQDGQCNDMIFALPELLAEISQSFTLQPGDVVLTGTPAGVGPLVSGDELQAELLFAGEPVIVQRASVK
ncbi:fumarylacetoacetate hydrolase family protein [Spongiibacter sp. KMU-158]|uniref:Fumarylacetoacetate hydrolase family protein n=1 Tax=Spongiibacter pelagi TaxID=2760804 RepID=A0A927GV20_9GAMM|nr:fumarylacetoacetate hydrolase family protein [Spongiibacter pelagi]MBD2857930.1 fumarylacetoacetate hydrolase family protein [Spongiibacter pelagi]